MLKSLFTEFFTTFIFVFVIALVGIYGSPLVTAFVLAALFAALVYVFGEFSGAHFNPAISLAAFVKGEISAKRFGLYVVAQLAGAVVASLLAYAISQVAGYSQLVVFAATKFPLTAGADTTYIGIPAFMEFLFTFLLVFAVVSVAMNKKKEGNQYYAVAIALVLFTGIIVLTPMTGASMNPAVALGSNIAKALQNFSTYFADKENMNLVIVYLIPQLFGGLAAGLLGRMMIDGKKFVVQMPAKKEISEKVEEVKEKLEK